MKNFYIYKHTVLFFALFFSLQLSPLIAQEETQTSSNPTPHVTLTQYLRSLQRQRITYFPSSARFIEKDGSTQPFISRFNGIQLTVIGNTADQEVREISVCLSNPQNAIQTQRWMDIITATLAIFSPESSEIDRILSINKAMTEDNFSFYQLNIQSQWQECGKVLTITLP